MKYLNLFSALTTSLILSSGFITDSARASSLITWNLQDVTPFESGQTLSGYFTFDQNQENLVDWNIKLTGGTDPILTNVIFNNDLNNQDCLIFCFRITQAEFSQGSIIVFRTPLASNNTQFELDLYLEASINQLLFPESNSEFLVSSLTSNNFGEITNIQFEEYFPEENIIRAFAPPDRLIGINLNPRIIYTSNVTPEPTSIPEPTSTFSFLVLSSFGGVSILKRKLKASLSIGKELEKTKLPKTTNRRK